MKIYILKDRLKFLAWMGRKAPDTIDAVREHITDNWHYFQQGWYKFFLIVDGELNQGQLLYAGVIRDAYAERSIRGWNTEMVEMGSYLAGSHDVPYKEGGFTIDHEFYRWKSFPHRFSKKDAMKALIACGKQAPSVKEKHQGPDMNDFGPGHEKGITF
ncbi:MAG: hypothetical protein JOZ31_21620 [Verrucomicrobia bacterium]|nr:hypothetical protein [Verrucomicrobiota bacterium]MBV8483127.1 hypothetical protein [Verrucomicrobiota bacterium]